MHSSPHQYSSQDLHSMSSGMVIRFEQCNKINYACTLSVAALFVWCFCSYVCVVFLLLEHEPSDISTKTNRHEYALESVYSDPQNHILLVFNVYKAGFAQSVRGTHHSTHTIWLWFSFIVSPLSCRTSTLMTVMNLTIDQSKCLMAW